MRRTFLTLLVAAIATPLLAQSIDIGPAVGAPAPTLMARDAQGKPRDLPGISGRKGVVLVFFRSARWCPYCQHQLIDLKAVQAPLAERGYALAAISYDAPEALAAFAEKQGVTYTLLSDEGSKLIDAYKLRDPQYAPHSFADGVPKPSIFVLDRTGVVRAKLAEEGYKVRPTNAMILAAVDGAK